MKQKRLKQYATGALSPSTPAPVTTVTGTTTAKQPKKLFKKERKNVTVVAKPPVVVVNENTTGQLTAEELEQLRQLIASGSTASAVEPVEAEPVENTDADDTTEPSTGSGSENEGTATTAQKLLAWAKANALYLGIAAVLIIYIMYKRNKS
jgi:hypothetical protein